jgi:hypothetical protein
MPLRKISKKARVSKKTRRAAASANIREFSKGRTFARTKRKFGAVKARKQAIAAGLRAAGLSRKRKKR